MPTVRLASGKQISLMHDGFVELAIGEEDLVCVWSEADCGTATRAKLCHKLTVLAHYLDQGCYARDFGVDNLTIAWLTNGEEQRLAGSRKGDDWRLPEVQQRYAGHFSPFINERIRRS